MPAFETMDRPQTATYWEVNGVNSLGQPTVGSPVELSVQWDNSNSERLDSLGNSVVIDATIFTDRVLAMGSIVRQGTLSDWQGTGSSVVPEGLMMIKTVNVTYDIKGRNRTFFYGLMRYNDELPTS